MTLCSVRSLGVLACLLGGALAPVSSLAAARFIGAERYGVRPGHEILWRIPVSGAQRVEAVSLPEGVTFDSAHRTLHGRLEPPGDYPVVLRASDGEQWVEQRLTLCVGQQLCLAPPMGWNSWYSYSEAVNQADIVAVGQRLEASGLADAGYSYVNIDDCWQGERPAGGALQPNEKFPDMRALCQSLHARGLKAGIYTTPWISSYAGFRGSSSEADEVHAIPPAERLQPGQLYGRWPGLAQRGVDHTGAQWHFARDARQFADWGFDYVKIDWKPNDLPTTERLAADLQACPRDIVLSLSNAAPLQNAPGLSRLANLWRTTGDIQDTWGSIRAIGRAQLRWLPFASEGHWNDPDMLQIGNLGRPNRPNRTFQPSRLSPAEARYQMTLWCMLSAPLLISCDLEALSPDTFALLTDPDLIELDQKFAAAPLSLVHESPHGFILCKRLFPTRTVFGFFNDSERERELSCLSPSGEPLTRRLAPHTAELLYLPAGQ